MGLPHNIPTPRSHAGAPVARLGVAPGRDQSPVRHHMAQKRRPRLCLPGFTRSVRLISWPVGLCYYANEDTCETNQWPCFVMICPYHFAGGFKEMHFVFEPFHLTPYTPDPPRLYVGQGFVPLPNLPGSYEAQEFLQLGSTPYYRWRLVIDDPPMGSKWFALLDMGNNPSPLSLSTFKFSANVYLEGP